MLEEARTYHLHSPSAELDNARLDLLELRRLDANTVDLSTGHWTSSTRALRVVVGGQEIHASVRVTPREEKLDEHSWVQLLADLENWLPGISVGPSGGTSGGLSIRGVDSPGFAAVALLPLVPGLLQALKGVTAWPRERTVEYQQDVPLRGVRRADGAALAWLSRHPQEAAAVDAWLSLELTRAEPCIPQTLTDESLDHPVNRYVVWALARARSTLENLASRLTAMAARSSLMDDIRAWCSARARAASTAALEIGRARTRSFLRDIRPAPPSEAALAALQDDPVYARFHRVVRPFLHVRYQRASDRDDVPARPTYELYELWTFLAVTRALTHRLAGWACRWTHRSSTTFGGGMGSGTSVEYKRGDTVLRLHFNKTFPAAAVAGMKGHHSISSQRRPDIVVELARKGQGKAWMFLDAKYRVSRASLNVAFESVHIYRDALRWPENGGACYAGFLLVPAMLDEAALWFSDGFHKSYRCGCLVVRPGGSTAEAVADKVMKQLGCNAELGST